MTALAADRDTPQMGDDAVIDLVSIPLAAATHVYRGSIVCLNQSGYGIPGAATVGLIAIGVAQDNVNNTGAAGAKSVNVRRGTFRFGNSATTGALTVADVGRSCFIVDDQTVSRIDALGTRPRAGRVMNVDSTGVWVEVGADSDHTAVDILVLAGADLSTTGQNLFVEMDSAGAVSVCNGEGEDAVGVLQNAPVSGAVAVVRVFGKTRVYGSAAVAIGALVTTTNAGKSKTRVLSYVDDTGTSATDAIEGSYVMGRALTLGALDTLHSIFLNPMGAVATTAR
jgi:hypothetical protein